MWAFIGARLRLWLLFAVAVPLATALVAVVRRKLEQRQGRTRLVRTLARLEDMGRRHRR